MLAAPGLLELSIPMRPPDATVGTLEIFSRAWCRYKDYGSILIPHFSLLALSVCTFVYLHFRHSCWALPRGLPSILHCLDYSIQVHPRCTLISTFEIPCRLSALLHAGSVNLTNQRNSRLYY